MRVCFGTQEPGVQSQDQGNSKVPKSWLLSSFLVSLRAGYTRRLGNTKVLTHHKVAMGSKERPHWKCSWLFGHSKCSVSDYYQNTATGKHTHTQYKNQTKQKQSYVTLFAHKFHLHRSAGFTCLYRGRSMSFSSLLIQYNHCLEGIVIYRA